MSRSEIRRLQVQNPGWAENQIQTLEAKLALAKEALESIEWITGYDDGSKDTAKADRKFIKEALEKLK